MSTQQSTGRRALVTGASGFIGRHLCRALAGAGVEVHGVSRSPREPGDGVRRWHTADLSRPDEAARAVEAAAPDRIFHLASHVYGSRDLSLVLPTFHDNLASTVHLLEAATRLGCERIVLAGSMESPDGGDAAAVPSSPYAAAKLAAATYAAFFHELYGTPVVQARIFMVYGPEQRDLEKLVPYTALSLLRGEAPRLMGGEREIDWIYVDDVVAGLVRLGEAPGVEGETVDLGSGRLVPVREVVAIVRRIVGGDVEPAFGALPDRANEQVRRADAERTAERIGWRAAVPLDDGLERTVAWCRSLPAPDAGGAG